MRNFLKYSGFCLREREIPCTPVGPDFSWANQKTYTLLGNKLMLRLPRHDAGKYNYKAGNPKGSLTDDATHRTLNYSVMPNQAWKYCAILNRHLSFYGPRFTGYMGNVYVSLRSCKRTATSDETSFFHPRVFEQAIAHELSSSYGFKQDEDLPDWQAPVNWQIVQHLPLPAARFDILPINTAQHPEHYVCFPLSDDTLIILNFSYSQHCNGFLEQRDREIDRSNMIKLVDDIVGSMELELSDEAKQQLAAAQADCPDTSVTKEFPPLKWPVYIDENGKESEDIKRKVLTNNFS